MNPQHEPKRGKAKPNVKTAPTPQEQALVVFQQIDALTVLKQADDYKKATEWFNAILSWQKQEIKIWNAEAQPHDEALTKFKLLHDPFVKKCTYYTKRLTALKSAYDVERARLAMTRDNEHEAAIAAANEKILARAAEKGVQPVLKQFIQEPDPVQDVMTHDGNIIRPQETKTWTIGGLTPEELASRKGNNGTPFFASDPRLAEVPRECLVVDVPTMNTLVRLGKQPACVKVEDAFRYSQR